MTAIKPRRIALDIFCGDWCGQCQFLEFVGIPDQREREPRCQLFSKRLRRSAPSSAGILRLGDCVAAENKAKESA
jgi:hypothetical protein